MAPITTPATRSTRRGFAAATACLTATALSLTAAAVFAGSAPASAGTSRPNAATGNVCLDTNVPTALQGAAPGELLADPQDVTAASGLATGKLFRVLYATTGPQGDIEASCGFVATPGSGAAKAVVAWAHGTVGALQACQPSNSPANFVGPMPAGIGSPSSGGSQTTGALVGMLNAGYVVVATDYYSGLGDGGLQYYALGVAEGLSVIDSARAYTGSAAKFGMAPVAPNAGLPLITWGHSQGGGSALWAGQLATTYLDNQQDGTLDLAGVAGLAPATQFTTSPGQPSSWNGAHLGDRDMYNFSPGLGVPLAIGPMLFSYVMAGWSQVTDGNGGDFPVGPTNQVNDADVLTPAGVTSATLVSGKCLGNTMQKAAIIANITKYLTPSLYRFFSSPFAGSKVGGTWTGAIDASCANGARNSNAVQEWCSWLTFNMPGPYGTSSYPELPLDTAGDKVPVYLAQGSNDHIMWCVDSSGSVQPVNCLTAQFVQSMDGPYCDNDSAYLNVDYFSGVSHFGVPGAAAMNSAGTGYAGSPLQKFVDGAAAGTLGKSCSLSVMAGPS